MSWCITMLLFRITVLQEDQKRESFSGVRIFRMSNVWDFTIYYQTVPPVSYTHLRERGSLPATVFIKGNFTSIFLKEWKYGDGKKNRVRDYCRFWFYYSQNMKKSHFLKSVCVWVCVCVSVSIDFFLWRTITAVNSKRISYFFAYLFEPLGSLLSWPLRFLMLNRIRKK